MRAPHRRISATPLVIVASFLALHCSAASNSSTTGSGGPGAGSGGDATSTSTMSGSGGDTVTVGTSTGSGGSPACDGADQKTSSGCDYYSVMPDITFDATGGCFAAFVVNPWDFPVGVGVEYAGQTLDAGTFGYVPKGSGPSIQYTPLVNGVIPPGEIAILFLNRFGLSPLGLNTDCPKGIVPAITNFDAAPHGTKIGEAFHITTAAPVVAYDIYPYGGGASALTSATLLLPTTSWGDNYIAASPYGDGAGIGAFGSAAVLSIVAHQDATEVTISPKKDILAGPGVAGTPKGVPATYTLDRGEVLQFTQVASLEGSAIQSNAPVGVWAAMNFLSIEACCGESTHQQIPPVRALGSEYVGVRYRNRFDNIEETPPWRMVGAVDGTTLTWEPATPPGAPTTLAQGQVAQFNAAGPFVVRSQDVKHPFYMSAHMTGASLLDPTEMDGRGDAEFVNVIPPGEYLNRYVFFTDPTYPETNLTLVRVKGQNGFADVELDCLGTVSGWQSLGSSGDYEYTRVDLVRHNFQPQAGCDNGRHEIKSTEPFGLTVWGWGSAETGQQLSGFYSQYVSYAYPGGASVAPINEVVVVPKPD